MDKIVEEARKRFSRAEEYYRESRTLAVADTKFALGDSDNGWQWDDAVISQRRQLGKPCLTINTTAQHCNQITNDIRRNRPTGKIIPVDNDADPKTATMLEGMIRSIKSYSKADTAHDIAVEHSVYGGEGYWRVLTDYEDEKSFDQVILIKPLVNPNLVYIDPDSIEPDRSDARWAFIFEDVSIEEAEKDNDLTPISWVTTNGWVEKDKVRRAEYYYREDTKDVLFQLASGRTILKSELAAMGITADVNQAFIDSDGSQDIIVNKRDTMTSQWWWCKLVGGEDKPVDKKKLPNKYLPIITVVGKEINVDGKMLRKGIVKDLKDPARIVNYSYSAAFEGIAAQTKTPYLAPAEAIEDHLDIWASANVETRAYLPYKNFTEDGQKIDRPTREMPAALSQGQVQLLQISLEQMRGVSGQQNANFGIRSEAQSGIGIQRLKAQGEVATFHFPDNLTRALEYEMRVILDLIPKVYDSKRIIRITGLDGKEEKAELNPEFDQPYAENDVTKIFNPNMGRYDVMIDTGPSYSTQRQESQAALTEISSRNPQLMQVAGDLIMKSFDFPLAEEMSERLQKALPPNLQDEKGMNQLPAPVKAMIAQMQEKMKEMHAEGLKLERALAEKEKEESIKYDELKIKLFEAETKRIQTLGTALNAEAIQALVNQTVQQMLATPDLGQSLQVEESMTSPVEGYEMSGMPMPGSEAPDMPMPQMDEQNAIGSALPSPQ